MLELGCAHVSEVFTAFGEYGVKAERVAGDAVKQAREYLEADVPVGPHLADQLLLPLGISAWQGGDAGLSRTGPQRGGSFRTLPLTGHATTHIDLLRHFLGVAIDAEQAPGDGCCTVRIAPSSI